MQLFSLLLLWPALLLPAAWQDKTKSLSPAEAIKQMGQPNITVVFEVKAAKERLAKRGIVFLDSETDFKSPDNLCIALSAEAAQQLKEKGVKDLTAYFQGKRIKATGCVMRFDERPYMPIHDSSRIQLLDSK